jgi:hypothetical protein
MVNLGMVNGGSSHVSSPDFREIFPAFARFPRFKNPLKYICDSGIRHLASPDPAGTVAWSFGIVVTNQRVEQRHHL